MPRRAACAQTCATSAASARIASGEIAAASVFGGAIAEVGAGSGVALAAGVGIAPIYSIIRHEVMRGSHRPIQLIYTNTTEDEIVFKDELDRLAQRASELQIRYVITREESSEYYDTRIQGADIVAEFPNRTVCMCGTVDFVRDIRQQLVTAGMSDDTIMTEVFFETKGVLS